jgi:hypothetical protein
MPFGEMSTDEVGRCFCEEHMRVKCHECCLDFEMVNEQIEADAGLRKPKTQVEQLVEQVAMCRKGIAHLHAHPELGNGAMPMEGLASAQKNLDALLISGDASHAEVSAAMSSEIEKHASQDADMRAVMQAWQNTNPGGSTMEWGGVETQRLYDAVAAKPPSAALKTADKRTCGWCGANSGAVKLKSCTAVKFVTAARTVKGLRGRATKKPARLTRQHPAAVNEGKEIAADLGTTPEGGGGNTGGARDGKFLVTNSTGLRLQRQGRRGQASCSLHGLQTNSGDGARQSDALETPSSGARIEQALSSR